MIPHNPQSNRMHSYSAPSINKVLTADYSSSDPNSYTEKTYFLASGDGKVAVSIQPVDGDGNDVAGSALEVQLYRSLDEGESWQLFKTYSAATEEYLDSPLTVLKWQFRLSSVGSNPGIRIRAM